MMDKTIQVLGWFVMGTLALAIARQLSEQKVIDMMPSNYGAVVGRHGLLEGFTSDVANGDAGSGLGDAGQESSCRTPGKLTAQTCYEKDFLAQSAKVGNYIQRTNNFPHAAADNCSAPLTEFVELPVA